MIKIENKKNCCGCTACKNICPKNAIEMVEDEEGFLYPVVDTNKCVNCRLCEKVCPIINKQEKQEKNQKAYVINNKDNEVRKQSTSGGAFTPIAEYVIENSGVVFGATFDNEWNVYHTYTENENDLQKFRGSKYVQSNLKNTFTEARNFLEQGRLVCFSGTPCQIQGLKSFLRKEYENLLTVDVVCRAVPSPLVLRKYLSYQKHINNIKDIKKVVFRDKSKYGYGYSSMRVEGENYSYQEGVETDPYLRAFFNNYSDRPSCFECKFRDKDRISDFTIWDCFTIAEFDKKMSDNLGTTRMIIQTARGEKIFNSIKGKYNYKEIEVENAIKNVRELKESPKPNERRKVFFDDINKMEEKEFFDRYFPNTIKVKSERAVRRFLAKTGLNDKIKNTIKKIIKKG